jgi:hypothetical protein
MGEPSARVRSRRRFRDRLGWPGPGLYLASILLLLALPGASPSFGASAAPSSHPIPLASPSPAAGVAPAAFTLAVDGQTPGAVGLQWAQSTALGFANYTIYESTNGSSGPWQVAGLTTTQASPQFVAANLTPGANYWWQVVANAWLGPQNSSVVNATQPALAYLNVTLPSPSTARFNWTNNATYGGLISFVQVELFEIAGTAAPSSVASFTDPSIRTGTVAGLAPGSSYTFYLNTTDCESGCGSGASVDSVTQSNGVTVGTPQPLVASISVSGSTVDAGRPDFFTCTPSGGVSPYTFQWSFGNGSFATGPASQSYTFTSPGTPQARCRVTDAAATASSAATTVTVNLAPSLSIAANRSAADVGQSVAFSCLPQNGTAPFLSQWSFGDGSGANSLSTAHTYLAAGEIVASCSAQDLVGTVVSDSVSILVSPVPVAQLTASSLAAAPGSVLSFNATASAGSGGFAGFTWSFGDGQVGTGAVVTHSFSVAGDFTVSVQTVDSNGARAVSETSVVVSPVQVQITAPPSGATVGTVYQFSASATGGAGAPYNFTWNFGDGSTGFGASISHKFSKEGPIQPTLVVRDRLGASVTTNLTAMTLTTPPGPPGWPPALLLIPAAAVGLVVGWRALIALRKHDSQSLGTSRGFVPPMDPSRTLKGVRVCRNCRTVNSAVRESCSACGATLVPSIFT